MTYLFEVIDDIKRTDFIHDLLTRAQARYEKVFTDAHCVLTFAAMIVAMCMPGLWPVLAGVVYWITAVIRSRRDLKRAMASVEQIYRREDARCRAWG